MHANPSLRIMPHRRSKCHLALPHRQIVTVGVARLLASVQPIVRSETSSVGAPQTLPDLAVSILVEQPEGLTADELCGLLRSRSLDFATLTAGGLERLLARRPERFVRTTTGRWATPSALH